MLHISSKRMSSACKIVQTGFETQNAWEICPHLQVSAVDHSALVKLVLIMWTSVIKKLGFSGNNIHAHAKITGNYHCDIIIQRPNDSTSYAQIMIDFLCSDEWQIPQHYGNLFEHSDVITKFLRDGHGIDNSRLQLSVSHTFWIVHEWLVPPGEACPHPG